jgi:transcriptional regulator with XRE-family HTH domain
MGIGDRIRERRQTLELTQQELAQAAGVTHQHVSRIESGHVSPSAELVVHLARTLGSTCDYLLTGDEQLKLDAAAAIRAEPALSPTAKKHLVGLVEELRRAVERSEPRPAP